MENASKALLMAAGILVGILILSLFVYELTYMSNNAKEFYDQEYVDQIAEFNAKFQKYANRKDINAQEVVTIYGYVKDWNENNLSEQITLTASPGSNNVKSLISSGDIEKFMNGSLIIKDGNKIEEKRYKCTLGYKEDGTLARVSEVVIKEI